jgi:hypothetical protein
VIELEGLVSATRLRHGHRPGSRVWWTRERVIAGLSRLHADTGQAPTDSLEYQRLIAGREYTRARAAVRRYPGIATVRRQYASLWDAWAAAGVSLERTWQSWSDVELWYLREAVGIITFAEIAADLDRSFAGVDAMVSALGLHAHRPRGLWPIATIAKAVGLAEKTVKRRLEAAAVPYVEGRRRPGRQERLYDPADLGASLGIRWAAVSPELVTAARERLMARIVGLLEQRCK